MKREVARFDFKAFGQAIKAARKAKGISRNQLADKMNIAPRYIASIENTFCFISCFRVCLPWCCTGLSNCFLICESMKRMDFCSISAVSLVVLMDKAMTFSLISSCIYRPPFAVIYAAPLLGTKNGRPPPAPPRLNPHQ